jgi:hypothetical protein
MLALTSLCRVSELAAIDFSSISVSDSSVEFALSKLRKNKRHGPLKTGLKSPHNSIEASTAARWMKDVLASSGIKTSLFSAHSTRGATAPKAFAGGVPGDRILKAGGWATKSTFSSTGRRTRSGWVGLDQLNATKSQG